MSVVLKLALRLWRRLTSMRTALILLFLLAVAAVPGSLLPQSPISPTKVKSYIKTHGSWGRFLDSIGMFDVFGSVWFAAIYLLLFISLVGCLVPRIRVHARALARKPHPAPRNLVRLPESGRFDTPLDPAAYTAAARSVLGRRWRVEQRREESGALTLSAEKGYSRETGNLIFHVALLAALLLIAVGRLYSYEGQVIVKQGQGVCNTITNYDQWRPGRFAAEGKVRPAEFCIDKVESFKATYAKSGEARSFATKVAYQASPDAGATVEHRTITVNHPLRLEGDRVYLLNHGFAPRVTIHRPDGTTVHQSAVFLATDATTLYSEGVYSSPGKPDADQDVGFRAYFAPTAAPGPDGTITSSSPDTKDPVLGLFAFRGDLNLNGQPRSVYTIDTSKMKKIGTATLRPGQSQKFPGGVSVTFDGWTPWVALQVSHDPAQGWLLAAAVAMVAGLGLSLGVRRRRLWVRVAPPADGPDGSPTVVTVGGLARSDSGNFTTEFQTLLTRLSEAGREDGADREKIGDAAPPHDAEQPHDSIAAGKD